VFVTLRSIIEYLTARVGYVVFLAKMTSYTKLSLLRSRFSVYGSGDEMFLGTSPES